MKGNLSGIPHGSESLRLSQRSSRLPQKVVCKACVDMSNTALYILYTAYKFYYNYCMSKVRTNVYLDDQNIYRRHDCLTHPDVILGMTQAVGTRCARSSQVCT